MRLAVISSDVYAPTVNATAFWPALESEFRRIPEVDVLSPPGLRGPGLRTGAPAWLRAIRTVRRADAVFWWQWSARPQLPLWALAYARPTAKRAAFVFDAWEPQVTRIGKVAEAQRLAVCFVAFREAALELQRRHGEGRFRWLPFGYADESFVDLGRERPTFAYWMGRRHEPLHQALLAYAESSGREYRYTRKAGEFPDVRDLNAVIAGSQYFVVTPPNLDNPVRTGSYSPLVMRYLEGLGSGARLLGVPCNREEMERMLPDAALVEVAADGSDLETVLASVEADPAAWETARAAARDDVAGRHGWRHRAQEIHRQIGESVHGAT